MRPDSMNSVGGSRYFLTFKDEAIGYRHVYFMKKKSEVREIQDLREDDREQVRSKNENITLG